nr:ubiquitin hydrolase [Tanacetum cinerariifolium]
KIEEGFFIVSTLSILFSVGLSSAFANLIANLDKMVLYDASVSVTEGFLFWRSSERSNVRGNQRNWNNMKSQQLGKNIVMKKACYNCGHFDHLSYDYDLWVKKGRSCPKNNNTHKSMPPKPAIHRVDRSSLRTNRSNRNAAKPKWSSFYKPAHPYAQRPFQERSATRTQPRVPTVNTRFPTVDLKISTAARRVNTTAPRPNMNSTRPKTTQDLVVILIQRVQRLERELKVRTPIQKVNRGRSRSVMAWVPKKV